MAHFEAVLFDLYDTLATINIEDYRLAKQRMAQLAGLNPVQFTEVWKRYTKPAARGDVSTIEERINRVVTDMGASLPIGTIEQMAHIEQDLQENKIKKIDGCDDVLADLSHFGFKLAVVTNTSSASKSIPSILGIAQWLDSVIFSFECHLLKPEIGIYQLAAERLNVAPSACVFVGDGNDMELDGAKNAGMYAIKAATVRDDSLSAKQSTIFDSQVLSLFEVAPLIMKLSE
ncbi:MAG: HAD family hydrolase [Ktedonobacteraceae bacterium]|nr:HAD family hydrolase [Ktedonobacteraceae bacterium]